MAKASADDGTITSSQPTANSQPSDFVVSGDSQTASDFINSQLKLEADAREALPFTFDYCTKPLGALRQNVFSCLTCNPPPSSPTETHTPAGICYACSIACHGEHTLVELFARRDFSCDCGTTKIPETSPCTLRINAQTGKKGAVTGEEPSEANTYNQNYRNRFCGCGELYDADQQKGTMFQCIGLATEEQGGCGEDWWHPECLMGLPRDWYVKQEPKSDSDGNGVDPATSAQEQDKEEAEHPIPPGFPDEDDFDTLICYKCVKASPWIRSYAASDGFRALAFTPEGIAQQVSRANEQAFSKNAAVEASASPPPESAINGDSKKRKADDHAAGDLPTDSKKVKVEGEGTGEAKMALHTQLPAAPEGVFSIFALGDNFRTKFCRCAECFPSLSKLPQLLDEEETYEPPVSEDGDGGGSVGTGSILDRGEAALNNVDRIRAIEGVMAYNHVKEKVKSFLQPFAQNGQAVSAEDIKAYFEKLRGDDEAIKAAGGAALANGNGKDTDGRREQSGY